MFHPLVQLLASRPELLARHAGAYAELVALQAGEAVRGVRQRALLAAGAALALLLGTGLAGVSLLLVAVVPLAQMPAAWLLAAAPAAPLLLASLLWSLRRQTTVAVAVAALQAQWAADMQLLAEARAE